jgi:glycosyltransferase involved in cell wall biosynthesis
MKRVTLLMRSYRRPKRTERAIYCIAWQTVNDWEALVMGDACPVLQNYMDTNHFGELVKECKAKGNDLLISNSKEHCGGYGYKLINQAIQIANGKYFLFLCNDDFILPNHFENYLSQIEGTDYDFMYFDPYVVNWGGAENGRIRWSVLQFGLIGHSELIIRTEFLKQMPPHDGTHGHDWALIENMIKAGAKYKKAEGCPLTYYVQDYGNRVEPGID